jgi:bifunctional non-homologous end joining protein LigD
MLIQPMLARSPTATSPSLDEVLESPEWVCHKKWDGARVILHLTGRETMLYSRTGQDLRPQFPELADLHLRIPHTCILDGELVALDDQGRDSLERLQLRIQDKQARRRGDIPVTVALFDLLRGGRMQRSALTTPLENRLRLLGEVLEGTGFEPPSSVTAVDPSWEGVVAKRAGSPYRFGKRHADWLKYKYTRRATVRATGITKGNGARSSSFGAVTFEDAEGVHRGQVGTGFSDTDIEAVLSWAQSGDWPLIEIEYSSISKTGLLIHTRYKGVRSDKEEADRISTRKADGPR